MITLASCRPRKQSKSRFIELLHRTAHITRNSVERILTDRRRSYHRGVVAGTDSRTTFGHWSSDLRLHILGITTSVGYRVRPLQAQLHCVRKTSISNRAPNLDVSEPRKPHTRRQNQPLKYYSPYRCSNSTEDPRSEQIVSK